MMGPRQVEQGALFYNFSIDEHVPADHLLRSIDRFVDLSELRRDLAPFYSSLGRPSAYSTNYLIDVDNAIRVRHQFSVRFPIGQTCRSAWGRHKAMAACRPRKILGPADSLSNPTSATKSTFSEHKLRCIR
jgi:hypothetical protein